MGRVMAVDGSGRRAERGRVSSLGLISPERRGRPNNETILDTDPSKSKSTRNMSTEIEALPESKLGTKQQSVEIRN